MVARAPATIKRSRRSTVSRVLSVIIRKIADGAEGLLHKKLRLIGPLDVSIVAVLAGVIPTHAMIAKRISVRAYGECQFFRVDRMAGVRPHLPTGMHGRQW